jgi:hypothetical protein
LKHAFEEQTKQNSGAAARTKQHSTHAQSMTAAITTRAAARRMAEAAQTRLLDLPDGMIERILIAASNGGYWHGLRYARLVCRRLHAAAHAAARDMSWRIAFGQDDGALARLALLPRLGGLKGALLLLDRPGGFVSPYDERTQIETDTIDMAMADKVARAFSE